MVVFSSLRDDRAAHDFWATGKPERGRINATTVSRAIDAYEMTAWLAHSLGTEVIQRLRSTDIIHLQFVLAILFRRGDWQGATPNHHHCMRPNGGREFSLELPQVFGFPQIPHAGAQSERDNLHLPMKTQLLFGSVAIERTTVRLPSCICLAQTSRLPSLRTRRPSLPKGSWFAAITSLLVRMSWISGFMSRRSLPAIRGAARIDHRLKWARYSSVGHAPVADFEHVRIVPVARPRITLIPTCRSRMSSKPRGLALALPLVAMSPVVRQRFPPTFSRLEASGNMAQIKRHRWKTTRTRIDLLITQAAAPTLQVFSCQFQRMYNCALYGCNLQLCAPQPGLGQFIFGHRATSVTNQSIGATTHVGQPPPAVRWWVKCTTMLGRKPVSALDP